MSEASRGDPIVFSMLRPPLFSKYKAVFRLVFNLYAV